MDTQHPHKLSHEEALELLPWHVNASLDKMLGRQVAEHVEHCERCQQEAALLANTIFAVNADDPEYGRVDERFGALMQRIERAEASPRGNAGKPSVGDRLRALFGNPGFLSPGYAGAAFAAVALVAVAAVLIAGRTPTVSPQDGPYEVLASSESPDQPPLKLMVHLSKPLDEGAMRRMAAPAGVEFALSRGSDSDTRFLITLPAKADAGDVSQLLMTLTDDTRVQRIEIVTD